VFFSLLFLLPATVMIYAQTPPPVENPGTDRPVGLMTFLGDDLAISAQFQDNVINEIATIGGYNTHKVDAGEFPESLSLSPDYPPDAAFLGDARYSMTGEYYVDMDDLQHFQLWLWTRNGTLVYTDEMVFEDMEEAESYLPPMVSWILSHITEEFVTVAEVLLGNQENTEGSGTGAEETTSDRKQLFRGKLNLGLRGGGSYNSYGAHISANGYEAGESQGFSGEGAVMVEFRIFRFLGIQAEAVFTHDTFKAVKITTQPTQSVRSTDHYKAMSLMFPFLLKMPIEIGEFTVSPFGGGYFVMPIGEMTLVSDDSGQTGASYSYVVSPPLGFMLGVEGAYNLGPGELFADLRFSRDVGTTMIRQGIQYSRSRLSLSLGYKFRLWQRR
jgi:hypothetical protein